MAEDAPVVMLFVRCEGGISHNPKESVAERDVGAAIQATDRFLKLVEEASTSTKVGRSVRDIRKLQRGGRR